MTHANPTPRSPADVLKSGSGYRLIESEMLSNGFSATVRITVLHQGSETLWQVEYPLHGAMFGATWWAARRVEVKRVEYRRVSP